MKPNVIRHVILSGGVGSRLWPLSRKKRPKQYLEIFNGNSLFQLCIDRNRFLNPKLIVVGNKDNYSLSREILVKSNVYEYQELIEAVPKNTAPAIAFAAFASDPDDILIVTPSDHLIDDESAYQSSINEAVQLASIGKLVTFGIRPTKAETAYGYIESAGQEVISFREKPNHEQAEAFYNSGNFLWNSGMFCFKASVYLEELKQYNPEVYAASKIAFEDSDSGFLNLESNLTIPSISIDYAVMEKSKNIAVIASDFSWSDMGSFDSLVDHLVTKSSISVDANGNISLGGDRHISFLGVSNIILIQTEDAILVLDKSSSQDVKGIFEKLDKENPKLTV